MKLFYGLLLMILTSFSVYCQNDDVLIKELNTVVKQIKTINPEDNFGDISFLKELAKGTAIIGIGKSTYSRLPLFSTITECVSYLGKNYVYKNRYLISSLGAVIDTKTVGSPFLVRLGSRKLLCFL